MIVGFDDGNEELTPANPAREFKIGDVVWLVGEKESLKELMS
jgi:sodium/hydrogen exchanger family protein